MKNILNKNIFMFLVVVLFGLLAVRELLLPGFYQSQDGEIHLIRLYQFHLSLVDGQLPVRWAANLFSGLGYPLFIVNYSLPYYLAEMFYILGFTLGDAFKTVLVLTFVLSTLTMYKFLRLHFSSLSALVGALLYTYAPYRFASIFTRGAFGESVAIAFVPAVFWSLAGIKKSYRSATFFLALTFSCVILSHTIVFVLFIPVILVYCCWLFKTDGESWKKFFLGFGLALGLSSFQLIPSIFERGYMHFDDYLLFFYQDHFLPLLQIFRIPYFGVRIDTPFQIGAAQSLAVILAIAGLLKRKSFFAAIFILIFFTVIFLAARPALIIWQLVPLLSYILYPWRFLSVALFCAAVLGAWFTDKIATGKFVVSLLLITAAMLTSRHYNHISAASTSGEDFYKLYSGTATSENEYFPKNASLSIVKFAEPSVEVIEGEGEIVSLSKRPSQWNIELSLKQPSRIKLALLSFPGWTIYRNGEKISYDSRYKLFPGLISIFLPSGFSKISVKFEETNLRKIGDAISLSCIFYLFSLLKYRLGDVR